MTTGKHKSIWHYLQILFDFFSSLKLAVFIILSIAFLSAWGTIYEARHGMEEAQTVVYHSWWFTTVLIFFFVNVLFAALSRIPWKRHHIGFLVTHLGILVILIGSFLTRNWGVDGTVVLGEGESASRVQVKEKYLNIFLANQQKSYELIFSQALGIASLDTPSVWNVSIPQKIVSPDSPKERLLTVQLLDWWSHAQRKIGVKFSDVPDRGVPAIHFRMDGSRANINEWLFLNGRSFIDLGPAIVHFQKGRPELLKAPKKHVLYLYFDPKKSGPKQKPVLQAAIVRPGSVQLEPKGRIRQGKPLSLGWMDFQIVVEEFYEQAIPHVKYEKSPTAGKGTVEVIHMDVEGEKRWIELGTAIQIFKGKELFYVQYARKEVELNFQITLKDFEVEFYPGTRRAMSYSSLVNVGDKDIRISMNEPLEHRSFTFYQASYSTDITGEPVISVLSVNRDPGRLLKYLGCVFLITGILLLFYFRPIYSGKSKFLKKRKAAKIEAAKMGAAKMGAAKMGDTTV